MVPCNEYNVPYEHNPNVVVVVLVLLSVAITLWLVFVALHATERRQRRALQRKRSSQQDPAHQLALIQMLGEAGRQEIRRIVTEVQQALATLAKGARR